MRACYGEKNKGFGSALSSFPALAEQRADKGFWSVTSFFPPSFIIISQLRLIGDKAVTQKPGIISPAIKIKP